MDKKHDLIFTLNKENNQHSGDKLTLKGEIIGAEAERLEFLVSTKDSERRIRFYILQIGGRWQADKFNRLSFLVTAKNAPENEIVLAGAWEINRQNQIVYTYTKTHLKTKKDSTARSPLKASGI